MRKIITLLFITLVLSVFTLGCTDKSIAKPSKASASTETSNFGSAAASVSDNVNLEDMMKYAIEDEYLARQEYESIIEEFGEQKPFSNIIQSEETHIQELLTLYETYGFEVPEDKSNDYVVIPESIQEAMEIGIEAEINNIAMYESFLEQDLPDDVREVFTELKNGSENHLEAFKRGASRGDSSEHGNGTGSGDKDENQNHEHDRDSDS